MLTVRYILSSTHLLLYYVASRMLVYLNSFVSPSDDTIYSFTILLVFVLPIYSSVRQSFHLLVCFMLRFCQSIRQAFVCLSALSHCQSIHLFFSLFTRVSFVLSSIGAWLFVKLFFAYLFVGLSIYTSIALPFLMFSP